jgi:hypothetical protein
MPLSGTGSSRTARTSSCVGSPCWRTSPATRSGPLFRQVRDLVLTGFPQADDVVNDGADRSLAVMAHPAQPQVEVLSKGSGSQGP